MIVRMAKVDIFGPRPLLMETLTAIRKLGLLHLEMNRPTLIDTDMVTRLRSLSLDQQTLSKRLFFEDLLHKIETLLDSRVLLKLWVKVQKNWTKDERILKELGF